MPTPITGESSTTDVLHIALKHFAQNGYRDTKLETISQESNMSKRMIHYHFGDKKGLYIRALQLAIEQLRPTPDKLITHSIVPAEGIKAVVEAIYDQMENHPLALRLLTMENLFNDIPMITSAPLADQSNILLQTDRILMLGQDSGAFRPDISAVDVYSIIYSICALRLAGSGTFHNLYATELKTERNTAGLRKLAVDAVLAFLTSNIQTHGNISYLHSNLKHEHLPSFYGVEQIYE